MIPAENIAGRRQGKAHVVAGMSRGVDALYFKIPDGKALSVQPTAHQGQNRYRHLPRHLSSRCSDTVAPWGPNAKVGTSHAA